MSGHIVDQLQLEANNLSRNELQAYLKSHNKPATGTTATLRQIYLETRHSCSSTGNSAAWMSYPPFVASPAVKITNKMKPSPAKAKAPPSGEKRLKKYRPTCSRGVQDRIARARNQRLFLVEPPTPPAAAAAGNEDGSNSLSRECTVLGSTGNVYKVTLAHLVHCTCPDHAKGNVCKHILFVMLKVVGLPATSPLVHQAALLSNELREIFAMLDQRMAQVGRNGGVMANARVREAYQDLTSPAPKCAQQDDDDENDKKLETTLTGTARQPIEHEDCPICFDPLLPDGGNQKKEQIVFCRAVCGYNFHKTCMASWKTQSSTCPNCRAEWVDDSSSTGAGVVVSSPEGYTNLGRLQGQRTTRDTSTYSEWYGRNKRRRRF
eukprot:scaffold2512_cov164-Amphora_coffeaeformis.AAC.6